MTDGAVAEAALVRHLVERKGFTEAGARRAVAAYIETMAFLVTHEMSKENGPSPQAGDKGR